MVRLLVRVPVAGADLFLEAVFFFLEAAFFFLTGAFVLDVVFLEGVLDIVDDDDEDEDEDIETTFFFLRDG